MAEFKLSHQLVQEIDGLICEEHKKWIEEHVPQRLIPFLKKLEEIGISYSVIKHPKLWSGDRIGETSIADAGDVSTLFQDALKEVVKQVKKQVKKNEPEIKEIINFVTRYEHYFAALKEKTLLMAIKNSTNQFTQEDINKYEDLLALTQFLAKQSFVRMQKREDCLKAHAAITFICTRLRKNPDFYQGKNKYLVDQTEILCKRLLDIHYKRVKKQSFPEFFVNAISTLSWSTGLLCGVSTAVCFGIGFAFPPFWVASVILGFISLIGYISSAISAANMIYEGIKYKRSPSPKEIRSLLFDIIMAPIYFWGGAILHRINHLVHHGTKFIHAISYLWKNILSNFIPDIFDSKEVIEESVSLGRSLTRDFDLMNTSAVTSFNNIMSQLLTIENTSNAIKIVNKTEEKINDSIAQLNMQKIQPPAFFETRNYTFAYVLLPSKIETLQQQDTGLKYALSAYHNIHILCKEFIHTNKKETKSIKEACLALERIYEDSDAPFIERVNALKKLSSICAGLPNDLISEKVKKLNQFIDQELHNISSLIDDESTNSSVVLVGVH